MEDELRRIRAEFVQRVSLSALKTLLDDLLQQKVLSAENKDSVMEDQTSKRDRARCLVDMVTGKGEAACREMIDSLRRVDPLLCTSLGLIYSPAVAMEGSLRDGPSAPIRTADIVKTDQLKDKGNIYPVMDPATRTRLALLINNVHFDHLSERRGAEKDEENMQRLLRSHGYSVVQHTDLSGVKMDEAVATFSKDARLHTADSAFVVIMSHGVMGAILGVHHCVSAPDKFPIDNIYKHLDPVNCPALLNKPKVIIIQACRGDADGSAIIADGPGPLPGQATDIQVDADDRDYEDDAFRRVHKEKDFICLLSCTADTVSYRHVEDGAPCIQYIVEIFYTHAHEDHIEELFRRVMKRFEDKGPSAFKRQMAVKERCTLTKLFYLQDHQ